MTVADFVVVGSSGGGGTIAWLLAKAGFKVVVLEQGADWVKPLEEESPPYNPVMHDEYRFRLDRPEVKRHPRGDYNTYRLTERDKAVPFGAGWTGSMLGGGSVIWGTWSFRATPIDFRLGTHFAANGQLDQLRAEGYDIIDWPVTFAEMEPYYNVAETLLAVSGDRQAVNQAVVGSPWYQAFVSQPHFRQSPTEWEPTFPFPCSAYPLNPVGYVVQQGFQQAGWHSFPLPSGMVSPANAGPYQTRVEIAKALAAWDGTKPEFWQHKAEAIWSKRVRDACNMCGFCGEFVCWGKNGPKSGSRASTLRELHDLHNAEIITDARVYEVVYDPRTRRASGVRFLDVSDPDHPKARVQSARHVIVCCGAVQSARLLLMSGPPCGLGNRFGKLGRYAMFHLFGLSATCTLAEKYQGLLHGELGHTGNMATFENYFVNDKSADPANGKWWKVGTMVSTAKKNPLENAAIAAQRGLIARDLLTNLEEYNRKLELRTTGDDLPMASNRVDLDPSHVDEYGFPVARITRSFGPAEWRMFDLVKPRLLKAFDPFKIPDPSDPGKAKNIRFDRARETLIGDHQMGTCRMGDDPTQSVLDRFCRLHDAANVFVVDTSFMPTGFGLNPMVTVVANALRVGTWIVDQCKNGKDMA